MQGFGSAFAFVGAMHVAALWFPSSRLALISGLTTGLGMIGAIIGNAAVAEVTQKFGWEPTLRDAGMVGLGVAVAMFLLIPRKAPPEPRGENPSEETLEPEGAFVRMFKNLRSVCTNPQTWVIGFIGSCLYLPLSLFGGLWGVPFINATTGLDEVQSSYAVSMLYVGWLVGGPISRLCGATAVAVVNMLVMLVGGILQPVAGLLLDWGATPAEIASGNYSSDDFRHAMVIIPVMKLLALGVAFLMKETFQRTGEDEILEFTESGIR